MKYVQIHRIGDRVAFYVAGIDQTLYLSEAEASELGVVLSQYALNVRNTSYLDSEIGTYETKVRGER